MVRHGADDLALGVAASEGARRRDLRRAAVGIRQAGVVALPAPGLSPKAGRAESPALAGKALASSCCCRRLSAPLDPRARLRPDDAGGAGVGGAVLHGRPGTGSGGSGLSGVGAIGGLAAFWLSPHVHERVLRFSYRQRRAELPTASRSTPPCRAPSGGSGSAGAGDTRATRPAGSPRTASPPRPCWNSSGKPTPWPRARRARADEHPVRRQGGRRLRAGGQPAGLAHRAVRLEGDRPEPRPRPRRG